MCRLLGFAVGSAASIAVILWWLGIPRLEIDKPYDSEKVDEREPGAVMSPPPGEPPAATDDNREAAAAETTAIAGMTDAAEPAGAGGGPGDTPPHDAMQSDPSIEPIAERRWHAFWQPFRSEIAARGFVTRLERVTGLDYRIDNVKSGVYAVSFAYGSDAELDQNLEEIHAATGLELTRE